MLFSTPSKLYVQGAQPSNVTSSTIQTTLANQGVTFGQGQRPATQIQTGSYIQPQPNQLQTQTVSQNNARFTQPTTSSKEARTVVPPSPTVSPTLPYATTSSYVRNAQPLYNNVGGQSVRTVEQVPIQVSNNQSI